MDKIYLDITKDISVEKFQTIAAAILKQGDRRTYCNKYNNSPHYKVNNFEVYLNPITQFTNWSPDKLSREVSDYNTIVIQDVSSEEIYYDLLLKNDTVVLTCASRKDCERIHKLFLDNYLPAIEKVFNLTGLK